MNEQKIDSIWCGGIIYFNLCQIYFYLQWFFLGLLFFLCLIISLKPIGAARSQAVIIIMTTISSYILLICTKPSSQ